jgi:15-cis-phytoene synthase
VRRELDAAGIADARLRTAYERCRAVNAQHGRTYYLATLLLPAAKRPYVHALYGFARYADDIVDDLAPADGADRARRFTAWRDDFLTDLEWGDSADPVCVAVLDTMRRFGISASYFRDFLDSMHMDLTVTEYATYEDLARYTWGSAAVIGLEMLPILGRVHDQMAWDELRPYAIDLGVAFQLTNFVRDVAEDFRRGRVYLPQDSLRASGVDRDRLAYAVRNGVVDGPIRAMLAGEIQRTRALYRSAALGLDLVHPTSQDCIRTAAQLYEGILDEVERADYDVFSHRISVPTRRRLGVAGPAALSAWRTRTARPRDARRSVDRATPSSPA